MSSDDLMEYMAGRLLSFANGGEGDEIANDIIVVQVVESTREIIEFAWTVGKKRHYLKLPAADVLRALTSEQQA